jgi:hypothetical protein
MGSTTDSSPATGASTVLAELHRVLADGGDGAMKFLNVHGSSTVVGADSMSAATGQDEVTIFGGHGRDVLFGSQAGGNATVAGSGVVVLGAGKTTVFAELGPDTISATSGASTGFGSAGAMFLGDSGQPLFPTGAGADLQEFSPAPDAGAPFALLLPAGLLDLPLPEIAGSGATLPAQFHDLGSIAGATRILLSDSTQVTFSDLAAPTADKFA